MKYRVLTYQGVYELRDCGLFDSLAEAQDCLMNEMDRYCEGDREEEERFLFDSRIEEVIAL